MKWIARGSTRPDGLQVLLLQLLRREQHSRCKRDEDPCPDTRTPAEECQSCKVDPVFDTDENSRTFKACDVIVVALTPHQSPFAGRLALENGFVIGVMVIADWTVADGRGDEGIAIHGCSQWR
jgi:hypothetical protein